ncbi:hypothetical protein J31TS6_47320 [Brevibacillus reuszeri]|nr:hypothetical protein J31TS6_47320 [Brevibacillus reuszeri]
MGIATTADLTVGVLILPGNFGRDIQFYNNFKQKGRANGEICAETA